MTGRRKDTLYVALLLAAMLAVFSHGFSNGATTFDDSGLVFENAAQRSFGWSELRAVFDPRSPRGDFGLQYTPLSDVSYALDRRMFGVDPRPYHYQGFLFHALAAVALFALVRRQSGSPECALLAAALFALHPLQVEAVTWIAGRRTAMAGAFMLCAMLAWRRARVDGSRAAYAASIALALLANFSKQSAVVIAPLLLVTELTARPRRQEPLWRTALAYAPHFAITGAFLWIGIYVGTRWGVIAPPPISRAARAQLVLLALGKYARMIAWPAHLQPIYRAVLPAGWGEPGVLAGAAVAAAGLAVVVATWRRAPLAAWGVLTAGIAIAPGLHALGSQVIADRYAYVSLGGMGVLAALLLLAAARRERVIGGALAAALVASLAVATVLRIEIWRSDVALFTDALASDPENANTRWMLGVALLHDGRTEASEHELRRAAALCMDPPRGNGRWLLPLVLVSLGSAREIQKDFEEAEASYAAAFQLARPREVDRPACAYADFCARRGRRDLARGVLTRAVERDPDGARLSRERLRTFEP